MRRRAEESKPGWKAGRVPDKTGPTRKCFSDVETPSRSTLVKPKRTASDMAPVLGIKTSSLSEGSISMSGQSGSLAETVSSFSGVSETDNIGESSEFEEHAFSFFGQDTDSLGSDKRVVDGLVLVLPAREFR